MSNTGEASIEQPVENSSGIILGGFVLAVVIAAVLLFLLTAKKVRPPIAAKTRATYTIDQKSMICRAALAALFGRSPQGMTTIQRAGGIHAFSTAVRRTTSCGKRTAISMAVTASSGVARTHL